MLLLQLDKMASRWSVSCVSSLAEGSVWTRQAMGSSSLTAGLGARWAISRGEHDSSCCICSLEVACRVSYLQLSQGVISARSCFAVEGVHPAGCPSLE